MKVMVIGGAGFIGSHLVDRLMGEGHEVTVIDDLSNGHLNNLGRFTLFVRHDVSDPAFNILGYTPDAVYYLACWPRSRSFDNPYRDVVVNTAALAKVAKQCSETGAHLIYASNSGIYDSSSLPINEDTPDNPTTPYDVDKLASENHLKVYYRFLGLRYTVFRFATVYGPRQCSGDDWKPVVTEFCKRLLTGEAPIINGDGSQSRDLIYVSDIVDALTKALQCKEALHKTMILGTGVETTVNEIYEAAVEATGVRVEPLHGERAKGDIDRMQYDCRYAQGTLGWVPKVGLKEGVFKTVKWMRKGGRD